MSATFNFYMIGNLIKDSEVKRTQGGSPYLTFTVANSEKWNDKRTGELRERMRFVHCFLYGKSAEGKLSQYLTKGKQVYVEGEISANAWLKGDDVQSSLQLKVKEMELCGGGDSDGDSGGGQRGGDGGQRGSGGYRGGGR